ncbi:MAG TPA: type II 3-dehydroquinate dehydratase, partial [Myxococcaceae bacterium]|nr:type II 3-dehydroquinate dehydratase [Myxococcaceae bacterium]
LVELGSRQSWRRKSVIKEACEAQIVGRGIDSYLIALRRLAAPAKPARAGRGTRAGRSPAKATGPTARSAKSIGRKPAARAVEAVPDSSPSASSGNGFSTKERKAAASAAVAPPVTKTLGRVPPSRVSGLELLTRALVRQKIAERLSGRLTPAGLATWARRQWLEVQRGAPAESGQRELLEDCLQSLVLSTMPASKLSEDQLIELMAQLDG